MADSALDTLRQWMEAGVEPYTLTWTTNTDTAELVRWRAFRQSNKSQLQTMAGWTSGRPYKIDSLPERMALAFADFLFNEPPLTVAADENDQPPLNELIKANRFGSRLRVAEDICVSEREVWWRVYTDPRQSQWPILEWTSRINVVPYILGSTVLAVAFITDLGKLSAEENAPSYRLIEYHEDLRVVNVLYEVQQQSGSSGAATTSAGGTGSGGDKGVGTAVNLEKHPVTAMIREEWTHNLPMLAGRVRNEEWMQSIYHGIEDILLELNEAHTIDSENFRLAGKKRAIMDKKYADQAGNAQVSEEILWAESDFNELEGDQGPFKILEYSYDADGYIKRVEKLEQIALTRIGLAKQLVDANASEGLAQTGTALRTRLLPTVASIRGKAKEWADTLPKIITLMQQVDNLPESSGGFSHQWTNAITAPSVTLQDPFPADAQEDASRHQTLVSSELESIEQAVTELRPNWTHNRRMLEVRRILANRDGYALDDQGTEVRANTPIATDVTPEQANANSPAAQSPRPAAPAGTAGRVATVTPAAAPATAGANGGGA